MNMYSMIEVSDVRNTSLKEHKKEKKKEKKKGLNELPMKMTVA